MKTFTIALLCLASCLSAQESSSTVLEAVVDVQSASPSKKDEGKIQPGSMMKLTAKVKNMGPHSNEPGSIYIRFALPPPLDTQKNSMLFQTEKIPLPAIPPGQTTTFTFKTEQQSPTVYDFVRYDWGLRQYQAVAVVGDREKVIGTQTITFSAYYYLGPVHQTPGDLPAKK